MNNEHNPNNGYLLRHLLGIYLTNKINQNICNDLYYTIIGVILGGTKGEAVAFQCFNL